jgi:hypothetical protein
VNESIAAVWLEHCFLRSATPLSLAVNQVHLSDEISHASQLPSPSAGVATGPDTTKDRSAAG